MRTSGESKTKKKTLGDTINTRHKYTLQFNPINLLLLMLSEYLLIYILLNIMQNLYLKYHFQNNFFNVKYGK